MAADSLQKQGKQGGGAQRPECAGDSPVRANRREAERCERHFRGAQR